MKLISILKEKPLQFDEDKGGLYYDGKLCTNPYQKYIQEKKQMSVGGYFIRDVSNNTEIPISKADLISIRHQQALMETNDALDESVKSMFKS